MTAQEIQERNKQIALMLGAIYSSHADAWGFGNARIEPNELKFGNEIFKGCVWAERFEKELKFHSDWNWLMTAAKFMLDVVSENDDMETWYSFTNQLPDIEAAFVMLSDFAKEYTKNK